MSANNLHRDEAAARARLLSVQSYDVDLNLTDGSGEKPGETTFRSRVVVRFSSTEAGASTYLDLTAAALHSATLNGTPV
ncbi:MAG: aminopeptidase, partial [Frankiales bacterium]|nr:aminopeptidase [Frankiales bacterium]